VGAVRRHQRGLLRQSAGLGEVAHHDEPGHVHAELAGQCDVLRGHVRLVQWVAGGAVLGLMQLLDSDPEADAGELADLMTARVLRAFGMSKEDADELCARPMPDQPAI